MSLTLNTNDYGKTCTTAELLNKKGQLTQHHNNNIIMYKPVRIKIQ